MKFSALLMCFSEGVCKGFLCFSGMCLRPELQMDMVSDCPGLAMEDEQEETFSKT